MKLAECSQNPKKTLWEKDKLLLTSNSPFPSVFKRLVLQTCKHQGLFGKGLRNKFKQISISLDSYASLCPFNEDHVGAQDITAVT